MISVDDVESFFETLLLGDFVENQNTAGIVVGGLLGMVPELEPVIVIRDICGALFNIQKHGGFAVAEPTQVVNLGFAAFGMIPEAGEAFKMIFKPLWKERAAGRAIVHSGTDAIEGLLHMKKGSAIQWIREELIAKWGSWMQKAINAVNAAIDACVELLDFLADAGGWKNWLIPGRIQNLAREMLPTFKGYKAVIDAPLMRAGNEIQEFLKDLVGEQAAAVVVAVGLHAAAASVTPGTRMASGHNAADPKTKGRVPPREPAGKTGSSFKADAGKGAGSTHSTVQKIGSQLQDRLTQEIVGISGEHIADYICAFDQKFRWGTDWKDHDDGAHGIWSDGNPGKNKQGKISRGGSPKVMCALYRLQDGANGTGIDSVWRAGANNDGKPYAVVEAKASRDEDAPKFHRVGNHRKPSVISKLGVNGVSDASEILEPIEDDDASLNASSAVAPTPVHTGATTSPKQTPRGGAKPKTSVAPQPAPQPRDIKVQMSHEWILANIRSAVTITIASEIISSKEILYSRHLFFTPFYHLSGSPKQHMEAKVTGASASTHMNHDGFHYGESEVKRAVNKKKTSLRAKHPSATGLTLEA